MPKKRFSAEQIVRLTSRSIPIGATSAHSAAAELEPSDPCACIHPACYAGPLWDIKSDAARKN